MKVASSRFSGLGRHMKIDPKTRPPLEGERFQVIVIGGGINGVAIARECARGGKRTLLVEQHDFASGTTSRSTRIIHGGLRYLEHAEIGLVRESLRGRDRLVRKKPHLVHPIRFVLALDDNSRRNALAVLAGLWVYPRMGGRWSPRISHRAVTVRRNAGGGVVHGSCRRATVFCDSVERTGACGNN